MAHAWQICVIWEGRVWVGVNWWGLYHQVWTKWNKQRKSFNWAHQQLFELSLQSVLEIGFIIRMLHSGVTWPFFSFPAVCYCLDTLFVLDIKLPDKVKWNDVIFLINVWWPGWFQQNDWEARLCDPEKSLEVPLTVLFLMLLGGECGEMSPGACITMLFFFLSVAP